MIQVSELKDLGKEEITPDLPDAAVAYKLHLECGKMINLFDWLQVSLVHKEFAVLFHIVLSNRVPVKNAIISV